jgi:hypothetical protein
MCEAKADRGRDKEKQRATILVGNFTTDLSATDHSSSQNIRRI